MSDLSELIKLLSSRTKEGKLRWKFDNENRITLKQGESIIDIQKISAEIVVNVRNLDGVILASTNAPYFTTEFDELSEIFDQVRRDALGVDKALSALKSSLLQL